MNKKFSYTKPKTYLMIMIFIFFLFFICAIIVLPGLQNKMNILNRVKEIKEDKYTILLKEKLESDEIVTLKDIFSDIDFSYAYVFHKSYSSGVDMKNLYNLDISLSKKDVKAVDFDYIRRIVFVDENNKFVFNWEYNINKVFILTGGYYITPETVISKEDVLSTKLCIEFEGIEQENYFEPKPEDIQTAFNESIKYITREELYEQNKGIDNNQLAYGDYNFLISPESEDKHQYLYRTTKDGRNSILVLYSEYGINTVTLGKDNDTIDVTVNVMINDVLTNVPITINITEYDRELVWAQNRVS